MIPAIYFDDHVIADITMLISSKDRISREILNNITISTEGKLVINGMSMEYMDWYGSTIDYDDNSFVLNFTTKPLHGFPINDFDTLNVQSIDPIAIKIEQLHERRIEFESIRVLNLRLYRMRDKDGTGNMNCLEVVNNLPRIELFQ